LIDNGDILGYAQWFYDVREKQYSRSRIDKQLATASQYMWKPSEYQEAEYAAFHGCQWSNEKAGYSGTGYVVFNDKAGSQIEWDEDIKNTGTYRLTFQYMLPAQNKESLQLTVEGVGIGTQVSFAPTVQDVWATKTVTIHLPSGHSKIQLATIGDGGPDVDYLKIQQVD
jgi:hypothetical protein